MNEHLAAGNDATASELDCAFHQEGVVDAPCSCRGTPASFAAVEVVLAEVLEVIAEPDDCGYSPGPG